MSEPTAAELRDALLEMLENLNAYIEREAAAKSRPAIEAVQAAANEVIRDARREAERAGDLAAERRYRLEALNQRQAEATDARTRIAAALGQEPHTRSWPVLAGEVERRLAEDAATIERLRSQVLAATMAGQMDEVRLPEYPEVRNA
jgi:hypothetical protein